MSQKIKTSVEIDGSLSASQIANATTDTDKFLVSDGGTIKYRTGAELATDLGIAAGVTSKVQHQVKVGVAINKGQAVYVTGADGTNMIVGLASNTTEATSSKTMGLLNATVSANGFADVITEGLLAGLDTSSAVAGNPVWLGTGGNLIYGLANKPYAPSHLVFIGIVTRVNANNGEIFVKVQNGFELDELHDVDLKTTTPINGHLLGFNGTLWVNKTIAGWLGYTPQAQLNGTGFVKSSGTTITYDNTSYYPASNPSGYISSYTETDTLASVTGRGNTTNSNITVASLIIPSFETATNVLSLRSGIPDGTNVGIRAKAIATANRDGLELLGYNGIDFTTNNGANVAVRISGNGNVHVGGSTSSYKFHVAGGQYGTYLKGGDLGTGSDILRLVDASNNTKYLARGDGKHFFTGDTDIQGNLTISGTLSASGYNKTNWDTAYGWGNHASAGYVPQARTITINGTSYDLSANRSWAVTASETDTLATVTARGAITTGDIYTPNNGGIFFNGNGVYGSGVFGRNFGQDLGFNSGGAETMRAYSGGYVQATNSFRAPIFYDSNNTGYYVDPSSISYLSSLRISDASSGASLIVGTNDTSRVYSDDPRKQLAVNADYYPGIYVNALSNNGNTTHGAVISMSGNLSSGGYRRWGMGIANTNPGVFSIGYSDNNSNPHYGVGGSGWSQFWIGTGGDVYATDSFRSPIFYDSNNTGYYVDPASTSYVNSVDARGFYTSSNPWGTSNSAWFPNGITTPNVTSWLYGTVYLGNAPGNGAGTQATASGHIISTGEHQAAIFYDYNNTAYYVDAASTSNLNAVNMQGLLQVAGTSGNYNEGMRLVSGTGSWSNIQFGANMTGAGTQANQWIVGKRPDGNFVMSLAGNQDGGSRFLIQQDGRVQSPVYYDGNDTNFYLDPNGTSNLDTVNAARFGSRMGSQSPDNSHPGFGIRPFYSWNIGQAGNATAGYSNGISIGSHPGDQSYGFQIVQNMWDDQLYFRRYNAGWQGWRTALDSSNYTGYRDWGGNAIYAGILYDGNNTGYYIDPNSMSNISGIVADNWFRANGQTGLYGNSYGIHFYAQTASAWSITGSGGNIELQFRSNHNSTIRGYVYADTSNNIGFLTSGGGWRFRCDDSGNAIATGDVTAYSDRRVKENIHTIDNALDKVNNLRGVYYTRIDSEDKQRKVGVIAQETLEVLPEVVGKDTDGMYNVAYGNITALLIEGMKEQQTQIEELKKLVNKLTNK
jgi:hypothetical protein